MSFLLPPKNQPTRLLITELRSLKSSGSSSRSRSSTILGLYRGVILLSKQWARASRGEMLRSLPWSQKKTERRIQFEEYQFNILNKKEHLMQP